MLSSLFLPLNTCIRAKAEPSISCHFHSPRNYELLLSNGNHALGPLRFAVHISHASGKWLQRQGEDCSYAHQILVAGGKLWSSCFMGTEWRLLLLGKGPMQQQHTSVGSQPRLRVRWTNRELESQFDHIFLVSWASAAGFIFEFRLSSKFRWYVPWTWCTWLIFPVLCAKEPYS